MEKYKVNKGLDMEKQPISLAFFTLMANRIYLYGHVVPGSGHLRDIKV